MNAALRRIAVWQADSGNIEGARRTAAQIDDLGYGKFAYNAIARAEAAAGDRDKARKTLDYAKSLRGIPNVTGVVADTIASRAIVWDVDIGRTMAEDYYYKNEIASAAVGLAAIGVQQQGHGDRAGAQRSFDKAEQIAAEIADEIERTITSQEIAKFRAVAFADAGDFTPALKEAAKVPAVSSTSAFSPFDERSAVYDFIAAKQVEAGDMASARKTVRQILGYHYPKMTKAILAHYRSTIAAELAKGDALGAWLAVAAMIDDLPHPALTLLPEFVAEQRDRDPATAAVALTTAARDLAIAIREVRGIQAQLDQRRAVAQAMWLGLEAAKLEEWDLATEFLADAVWLGPGNAQALYNLALALDRGGRVIPAIGAFRAYLAVAPSTSVRAGVLGRLSELERDGPETVLRFVINARGAATSLTDTDARNRVEIAISTLNAGLDGAFDLGEEVARGGRGASEVIDAAARSSALALRLARIPVLANLADDILAIQDAPPSEAGKRLVAAVYDMAWALELLSQIPVPRRAMSPSS